LPQVRGTLVLLPLLFRCRPLGCVYLLAPWDIHAALGKAALQETAALLASGTFRALLTGGLLQQQWYAQVLSEGPMPAPTPLTPVAAAAPADGCSAGAAVVHELNAAQYDCNPAAPSQGQQDTTAAAARAACAVSALQPAADIPGQRCCHPSAHESNGYGSSEGLGQAACEASAAGPNSSGAVAQGQESAAGFMAAGLNSSVSATTQAMTGSNTSSNTCVPLPLSTTAAAAQAVAAAEAAAAYAAAMAPVGLPVSGHACSSCPELVLWPELLDVKDDLARSRHTAVSWQAGTRLLCDRASEWRHAYYAHTIFTCL
jgi:hypothetical protein